MKEEEEEEAKERRERVYYYIAKTTLDKSGSRSREKRGIPRGNRCIHDFPQIESNMASGRPPRKAFRARTQRQKSLEFKQKE